LSGELDRETVRPVLQALQGCRVYHFHDTSETAGVKLPG
jgi:predicted ATPase